jgi:hypothetical protein
MSGLGASSHYPWLCTRVWFLRLFSFEWFTNGGESLGCADAGGVWTSPRRAPNACSPTRRSAVGAREVTRERVEDRSVGLPDVAEVVAGDGDPRLAHLGCPLVTRGRKRRRNAWQRDCHALPSRQGTGIEKFRHCGRLGPPPRRDDARARGRSSRASSGSPECRPRRDFLRGGPDAWGVGVCGEFVQASRHFSCRASTSRRAAARAWHVKCSARWALTTGSRCACSLTRRF